MEEEIRYFMESEINPEDDNFYSERVIDRLLEDDELTSNEEGFMIGYMGA